mmetsp:Transcript_2035/g.3688  ORF Transcript_2035/g.3688 Transcript_2035/m.3688 type:complete len:217 (+) Transcript_2035:658-1308(+)
MNVFFCSILVQFVVEIRMVRQKVNQVAEHELREFFVGIILCSRCLLSNIVKLSLTPDQVSNDAFDSVLDLFVVARTHGQNDNVKEWKLLPLQAVKHIFDELVANKAALMMRDKRQVQERFELLDFFVHIYTFCGSWSKEIFVRGNGRQFDETFPRDENLLVQVSEAFVVLVFVLVALDFVGQVTIGLDQVQTRSNNGNRNFFDVIFVKDIRFCDGD